MPRFKLFSIVFALGLVNAMIRPIREHVIEFGFVDSLIGGFGISFIVWFGIYCSFDLLRKYSDQKASRNDWVMAFLTIVLLLIPSAFMSWIALSIFAGYCGFFVFQSATFGRNSCLIMLAVALRVPVSDICLKLSADALLQFDAMATLSLLSMVSPEATRQGNIIIGSGGHELLIMTGCASFTNISLAFLLWFTVVRAQMLCYRAALTLYIIPLTIIVMGINISRLSLMTLSQEQYFFYHDGLGAEIINALILLAALGMAFLSVYLEDRKYGGKAYVA